MMTEITIRLIRLVNGLIRSINRLIDPVGEIIILFVACNLFTLRGPAASGKTILTSDNSSLAELTFPREMEYSTEI